MLSQNFKIESNIYPNEIIIQAIDDFVAVANISYIDSNLSIETKDSHTEIFREFMNYVLSLYNETYSEIAEKTEESILVV